MESPKAKELTLYDNGNTLGNEFKLVGRCGYFIFAWRVLVDPL